MKKRRLAALQILGFLKPTELGLTATDSVCKFGLSEQTCCQPMRQKSGQE